MGRLLAQFCWKVLLCESWVRLDCEMPLLVVDSRFQVGRFVCPASEEVLLCESRITLDMRDTSPQSGCAMALSRGFVFDASQHALLQQRSISEHKCC